MSTRQITAAIDGSKLSFTFIDGKSISVDAASLSEQIKHDAMMHGLKQKLSDAGAKEAGAKLESKYVDMMATLDSLYEGVWNRSRNGGGGVLAEALARAIGKDLAEAVAIISAKDDEGKKAIRNHPEVARAHAAIMAERAAKKADALTDTATDLSKLL